MLLLHDAGRLHWPKRKRLWLSGVLPGLVCSAAHAVVAGILELSRRMLWSAEPERDGERALPTNSRLDHSHRMLCVAPSSSLSESLRVQSTSRTIPFFSLARKWA